MSSADRIKYWFVKETAVNVLQSAAAFLPLRITSESLKSAFQYDQSKELRPDRTEPDNVLIAENVMGDINHELLYDAHADLIAAVCGQDDWTTVDAHTKTLINGVAGKSFAILKQFADLGDINHLFNGIFVNTWNLNIQKKSILTGAFGLTGMSFTNGTIASLTPGTETYGVASGSDPFNGSSHVVGIKMNGSPILSAVDGESFSINNNYKPQEQLGSLTPTGYTQGRIQVTGTMDIYFKTEAEFNMYKAGTPFSHEIDLVDNAGNGLNFLFDRCKFEDMDVLGGGTNQDVIAKGKWRASFDPGNNRIFQITATTP